MKKKKKNQRYSVNRRTNTKLTKQADTIMLQVRSKTKHGKYFKKCNNFKLEMTQ